MAWGTPWATLPGKAAGVTCRGCCDGTYEVRVRELPYTSLIGPSTHWTYSLRLCVLDVVPAYRVWADLLAIGNNRLAFQFAPECLRTIQS